jgi:radical SAM superfamily enzyme YgiQ (UPF0313 family)
MASPKAAERWLTENAYRLDNASQYLGDEPNAARKPWDSARVRWCLVASWPYFHAAGNQSIPSVYCAINSRERYLCDRFYLPETPRDLRLIEKSGLGVFGIESKRPLADFDVVGTSISYVVLIMNFCKMLQVGGIPLRWRDREAQGLEQFPMVMAGGQGFCAPEPLAPVVDCWYLGEAEDEPGNGGIGQVCQMIDMLKSEGMWQRDRLECYRRLARTFRNLYFPRFVEVSYHCQDRPGCGPEPSKQVAGYRSTLPGMPATFRKRHVIDLDAIAPLDSPPLLFSDNLSLGAGDIETSRGCPAWCSFCRLTFAQKPFRQRSVPYVTEFARRFQASVGGVELSPFGPDFPMQTNKKRTLKSLLENVSDRVDSVAMRVDDFGADDQYVMLQAAGGSYSITLGLEGVSQRMRDLVGKGTSEEEVCDAVRKGIRAGFRKFKIFMIIGLPGEDERDLAALMRLARKLATIRDSMSAEGVRFQFSWTPLLTESNTPFQWFAPATPNHDLIDVIAELRELGIDAKIGTKAQPDKIAFSQLCQRASRDVGEAVIDVLAELGTGCWGGVPRGMKERLEAALKAHGFANGYGDCLDERTRDDLFGWEFIDTGVAREVLWDAYAKMLHFAIHTDSRTYDAKYGPAYRGNEWIQRCDERCMGNRCGVCDRKDLELRRAYIKDAAADADVNLAGLRPVDQRTVACRIRAAVWVPERYRFVPGDHWLYSLRRAAYRAQSPGGAAIAKMTVRLASSVLYKPKVFGLDYAEWGMTGRLAPFEAADFIAAMREQISEWLPIGGWAVLPAKTSMPAGTRSLYEMELGSRAATVADRLAWWHTQENIPVKIFTDTSYFAAPPEEVNARELVEKLYVVRCGGKLILRMMIHGKITPYQVYAKLMGEPSLIEAAVWPIARLDTFRPAPARGDLLSPACQECGEIIPVSLLDVPWDENFCPPCLDADPRRRPTRQASSPGISLVHAAD